MKAGKRTAMAAGGVMAVSALLAACGGGSVPGDAYGANNAAPAPAQSPAAATPDPSVKNDSSAPAETAPAAPSMQLMAANNAKLGWVVTDGKGWILYRFDKDRGGPTPKSTCNGPCAEKWPPVVWKGKPALDGVSSRIVGKVQREDGTWQLTLHGWPVYRFAGDSKPGQWKGQGVGHTWFTIKRTGARNTVLPSAPTPAPAQSAPSVDDGYGNSSDY
jgi:predicted lipoprotein with Yx(FWY)xxD motif